MGETYSWDNRRMCGRFLASGEEPTNRCNILDQIYGSWNLPPQRWYKIKLSEVWLGREAIQDMHMFYNTKQKPKYSTASFQGTKARSLYTVQFQSSKTLLFLSHSSITLWVCIFDYQPAGQLYKKYARWCLPVVIAEKNSPSFANRS